MFYWAAAQFDLVNAPPECTGGVWLVGETCSFSASNKAVISVNHSNYMQKPSKSQISPTPPYWGYYGCIIRFPATYRPFGCETA
jgi:hypothetical protein